MRTHKNCLQVLLCVCRRWWVLLPTSAIHFMYISSAWTMIWNVWTTFAPSEQSFLIEVFYHTKIKIWNFWASPNRHYSLIHNVYKLSNMISCWNLHWEYFLINGVYKWRHENGHVTLLGYAHLFENFQIKCQPKQNLWSWSLSVINLVKRYHAVCRPECVLGKS